MSSISSVSSSSNAYTNASTHRAERQAKMFAKVDTDGSGGVDKTELQSLFTDISKKTGTTLDAEKLFSSMAVSYTHLDVYKRQVEGFLEELQDRADEKGGPLVIKLAKAPGAREQRWAHLMCGPVDETQLTSGTVMRSIDFSALDRIERLESELAQLRTVVQRLCAELGVSVGPGLSLIHI